MKVKIEDCKTAKVKGVRFCFANDCNTYEETYFTCTPLDIKTSFASGNDIVCGIINGWHHVPSFSIMETHRDKETFVYTDGVALMPFCDIVNGEPDLTTAQIVRIPAGTQVEVDAGKAHFVAVAEGDRFSTVVYCPNQPADRITLSEPIEA